MTRRRAGLALALVLSLAACQPTALTRDHELAGAQRGALWLAVGLIPLVAAALLVLQPRDDRPSRFMQAGAVAYAGAGCAVVLALAVGLGAAIRMGGLACGGVADPDAPRTLLQLGCTPGFDQTGMLLAVCLLIGVPLAAALLGAALLLSRGHGAVAFAPLAAIVCGGAVQGARYSDTNSGALRIAVGIAVISGFAAAALLADLFFVPVDQSLEGSSSPSSPGTTRSHRSRQSSHR